MSFMVYCLFTLALIVGGISLLWVYGGWQIALGAVLLIWGTNLEQGL